ncbi:MAG TPA: TIGR03085 family metal-binding protein [Micromonosporaceae bacterium]|nr:TIGR03085 family metal-binding protein [Micromonosporaceae bacterium]
MTALRPARAEREALADLMVQLGPDAPTLCTGWTTRDLAAHLVVRERRPDAAPGILLNPLRDRMERVRAGTARAEPYDTLIEKLRNPPWWSMSAVAPIDVGINTAEFFVHHEDVRRAQPDWTPRELPPATESALWSRAKAMGKLGLRRFPATVVLHSPGYGETKAGRGGPEVRLSGPPGELLLFCFGRQRAAQVNVVGPDDLVDRLRTARLGL